MTPRRRQSEYFHLAVLLLFCEWWVLFLRMTRLLCFELRPLKYSQINSVGNFNFRGGTKYIDDCPVEWWHHATIVHRVRRTYNLMGWITTLINAKNKFTINKCSFFCTDANWRWVTLDHFIKFWKMPPPPHQYLFYTGIDSDFALLVAMGARPNHGKKTTIAMIGTNLVQCFLSVFICFLSSSKGIHRCN